MNDEENLIFPAALIHLSPALEVYDHLSSRNLTTAGYETLTHNTTYRLFHLSIDDPKLRDIASMK